MHRSTHIFLLAFFITLIHVDRTCAENKQSIATAEFLSVLAKNVANVLSPTLVGELHDGRPNRTTLNATLILPITIASTPSPKGPETTTESSKLSSLEADTVRSAQTQAEVRPGTQGFPFNFDDNNYRYNYPGANSQGYQGRPDYPPFNNPSYYNPDPYRTYTGQEGNLPRGENVAEASPVEILGGGQPVRSPDSHDPQTQNFERFRNFERFSLNNQFPSGSGNFNNLPFVPQRHEGRFGQPLIDPFHQNSLTDQNFAANPNYQNSIGNNGPRNAFQTIGDPYQQRQQTFRSNNFDFLPSQRFQNPFDNYPRSLQRGPNFPGFYPIAYSSSGQTESNFASSSTRIEPKKIEETSSSEIKPKSEIVDAKKAPKLALNSTATTENPVLNVQGQIRFGRLILPALDDYSDLRFRPDAFREYLFTPSEKTKNKTDNAVANDV